MIKWLEKVRNSGSKLTVHGYKILGRVLNPYTHWAAALILDIYHTIILFNPFPLIFFFFKKNFSIVFEKINGFIEPTLDPPLAAADYWNKPERENSILDKGIIFDDLIVKGVVFTDPPDSNDQLRSSRWIP